MTDTNLISRIQNMRDKYLEADKISHFPDTYNCQDLRKAKKIKKKLITLEKEQRHYLMENQDVSLIDQQIARLKDDFIKHSTTENSQDT